MCDGYGTVHSHGHRTSTWPSRWLSTHRHRSNAVVVILMTDYLWLTYDILYGLLWSIFPKYRPKPSSTVVFHYPDMVMGYSGSILLSILIHLWSPGFQILTHTDHTKECSQIQWSTSKLHHWPPKIYQSFVAIVATQIQKYHKISTNLRIASQIPRAIWPKHIKTTAKMVSHLQAQLGCCDLTKAGPMSWWRWAPAEKERDANMMEKTYYIDMYT